MVDGSAAYWGSALLLCWAGLVQALPLDVRANGYAIEAGLTSVFVLPNETVTLTHLPRQPGERLKVRASEGTLVRTGNDVWIFQPGTRTHSQLQLESPAGRIQLQVFRLTPFAADQRQINGYPIGRYPTSTAAFTTPAGLLAVDQQLAGVAVSSHFRLEQFVARQPAVWPRYLYLTTPLLETLEHLIGVLHQHGWPGVTLTILSGYRTPVHNQRVGGAARSRHIYGDAVDLIADADGDGRMDDLNQDSTHDREDVEWLIARLARAAIPATMGGVGSYESSGPSGAFLHLDTRGKPRDWLR